MVIVQRVVLTVSSWIASTAGALRDMLVRQDLCNGTSEVLWFGMAELCPPAAASTRKNFEARLRSLALASSALQEVAWRSR